ncbi:uncharacterized protein LOC128584034 isoform X1 [Nycticebus coucang]|uniref:uncharacterized protein LOC128584034 isoform X1 n=1 Tax=Nycticebus coucang TaxID=9470 RepID=UPI00234E1F8B|nr:uncharacterized protein LOC128584034 isoform X1 [Nycticebus coucang]
MAGRVGRALDHLEPVSVCSCVFPVTASASRSFPLFLALLGWGVRLESRGSCHSPSFGVVPRQLPSRGPVQNRVWKEWGGRGSHVAPLLNDRELSSQPLPWGPAPGVGSPGLWSLLFVKAWGGGFGGVGRRSKRLRSTPTWTWVVTGTANCALPRQHLRRFPVVHQSFVYIQESVSLHSGGRPTRAAPQRLELTPDTNVYHSFCKFCLVMAGCCVHREDRTQSELDETFCSTAWTSGLVPRACGGKLRDLLKWPLTSSLVT